jgi:MFS family permease
MNILPIKKTHLLFNLFITLYFLTVLFLAFYVNIWEDEAYTLNTTSGKLSEVISDSYSFEGQPPVYFVLLSFWRLIHPGIFTARLFSVLCIFLTVFVLNRLISLLSDIKCPNWIIVVFLLNPFTVWAALEIRTYALLILLAAVAIYCAIIYVTENRKAYLYFFLFISLIGLYTQYYFAFLIAAIAISILVQYGWNVFFRLSLHLIPVLILFLPNFYFLSDNVKNFQSHDPGYSMNKKLSIVFISFENIILGLNIISTMRIIRWLVRVAFILMVVASFFKVYKKPNNELNLRNYNLLLIISVFSLVFFVLFTLISGMRFNLRYLAISFPSIVLLFVIFNYQSGFLKNIIYGVLSIYFLALLTLKYSVPIKSYDFEYIAKFVEQIEEPCEPLLFNSRTISIPFQYYYTGKNELAQLPDSFKLEKEGFQVLLRDTTDVKLIMENIANKSFIFVNDNMIGYGTRLFFTSEVLDMYIKSHFNTLIDTVVFGKSKNHSLRIRRLEHQQLVVQ